MKRVLFVCTGNRARGRSRRGCCAIWPVTGQRYQSVEEFAGERFDYVITVCASARERCPAFPGGGKRIHWSVEDPAEAEEREETSRQAFRAARDDLRTRIEGFLRRDVAEGGAASG